MSIPPETAGRLTTTFSKIPFASHPAAWDNCYTDEFTPWDRSAPSLALADLLAQRPDLVPPAQERDSRGNFLRDTTGAVSKRTALVPGCGRGYDVLLLSAYGYDVWGLDTSETAIKQAQENAAGAGDNEAYKPVDDLEKGRVNWVVGNFFADDWTKGIGTDGSGKFDLIFDYTFLCALPLDVRPQWAKRMSDLVSPHGRLVCLEYPSGRPLTELGPAWGVWPEVYEALLTAPGDPVEYNQDGTPIGIASPKPRDDALHRLSLIKPRRTHKAGTAEDGSVRDFISVWSR